MILAVDEAIPYWEEAFTRLGEVRPFPGRKLRSADVRDADALVVRSVTNVNAALLEGSSVRFVGSATIGMDHVDTDYLRSRGIQFANAAGCNANAVSEYIVAALMRVAEQRRWTLREKSLAVIGAGNVGSRVEEKARALGMNVLLCDPPLRDQTGDERYHSSLDEVLNADILTLHVPLTTDGPYPTWHMLDKAIFDRLSSRQFLINSSRGPVVSGQDLKSALDGGKIAGAVLDVWEGEPEIDLSLLDLVEIGTPHIAGYSVNGKIRATSMIFEEVRICFGTSAEWDSRHLDPPQREISVPADRPVEESLGSIVSQAYDILGDDGALRALHSMPAAGVRSAFDRLRNQYRFRPEFPHFTINLPEGQSDVAGVARALGFQLASSEGN